jgi:hypothetical protein
MNTERDILDSKIQASATTNGPTYPGPDGKMFIFETLYHASSLSLQAKQRSAPPKKNAQRIFLPPPLGRNRTKTPPGTGVQRAALQPQAQISSGVPGRVRLDAQHQLA